MDRSRAVEIQARSRDEAVRLALEQLGVTRDKVDVQILAETEDDIYGEGEVLVRVELKPGIPSPRPASGGSALGGARRDDRGERGRGGSGSGAYGGQRPAGGQVRDGRPRSQPAGDGRPRDSRPPRPAWAGSTAPADSRPERGNERTSPPSGGGQRRGGHDRRSHGHAPNHGRGNQSAAPTRLPVAPRQPSQANDPRVIAAESLAKQVVRELLDQMLITADVTAVDNPSIMPLDSDDPLTVFIDITGRDLGMLIGRRGEHLGQLQYIVNLLTNRQSEDWVRVIVDVEGYRSQREESLIGLAERVASQVARNRRSISLEPMPPNERRIVHMTLREMGTVRTESSGEGDMRRVTIYPLD